MALDEECSWMKELQLKDFVFAFCLENCKDMKDIKETKICKAEFLQGAVTVAEAGTQPACLTTMECHMLVPLTSLLQLPKSLSHLPPPPPPAFYLQIILANFSCIVSVVKLAPPGFMYIMCS